MNEKQIADAIEEMVDEVRKFGTIPYALICSRKTFKKLGLYFRTLSPIEEKFAPLQIWFKYDFGDLPLLKFKYCPEDKVFVVDKSTYEKLMEETKSFSATTHIGIEALPLDEQKRAKK